MSHIIGIDLGTTFSCVAVFEGGGSVVIPNALGKRLTPSVVHILESGDALVGEHALRGRFVDAASTITGIKRLIGRRYNEVADIARTLPYTVGIDQNNLAVVDIRGRTYTPQVISALILSALKSDAEDYLGASVTRAVITVPAYFNEIQRHATIEAARIAGLETMRLLNEPTAASMAYGLNAKHDETIAVFDLGGGTFDISILETGEGVNDVRATGGDGFLGGDDFDERVADWMSEEFLSKYGIDVSGDRAAAQRVRAAAIDAKHEISERQETQIRIPFLAVRDGVGLDFEATLSRAVFQELCEELYDRLAAPCTRALDDAGVTSVRLDRIIVVGGATRMPGIDDVVRRVFAKEPTRSVNPDEVVALGAAVQAGIFEGSVKDLLLLDVTPASLGVETEDGAMICVIPRNTTIPTRKSDLFTTAAADQTSVEIHVLQGEHELADANRTLGRLVLRDIARSSPGAAEIEVTFDIDANGILAVEAKHIASGKEAKQTLLPDTGLHSASVVELRRTLPTIRRT